MNKIIEQNSEWINATFDKIVNKMDKVSERTGDKIPYSTVDGLYDDRSSDIYWWTNGFWGGMMWIMYHSTKDEKYRKIAESVENKLDEALYGYDGLHHDVGFMWLPTSVTNYKITGNESSKRRGLIAANILAGRYNLVSEHIRAWNEPDGGPGIAIIDCMMNIPLLYWASDVLNDPRFKNIAMCHADTTMTKHIRPDGSVKHIVIYDHINGGLIEEQVGQGFAVGSSWSRGQSWALYGYALSYIYTKKEEYLDTAKRVAHYFISCVCDDYLPKCDFRSPQDPIYYDSTAGAVAACGLIEIANVVPQNEKGIYINAAINILKALEKNFCNWEDDEDSILQMGTEAYHRPNGIHIPIIYGDYYFIEAIYKLKEKDYIYLF